MSCSCIMINSDGSRRKRSRENCGESKNYLYKLWADLKYRSVVNRITKRKNSYRNKGIKISEEWMNSFSIFKSDMGERPSPLHSIDRINNLEGYCKHNTRWATPFEQSINRIVTKKESSWPKGISYQESKKKFLYRKYLNSESLHLGYFKTLESAVLADSIITLIGEESIETKKKVCEVLSKYFEDRAESLL